MKTQNTEPETLNPETDAQQWDEPETWGADDVALDFSEALDMGD